MTPEDGSSGFPALSAERFAKFMDHCGPFEPSAALAVGVSGGADSMALVLLAHEWAAERGGRVVGLTVDHGLRSESAEEARQVGAWLAAKGIGHAVLNWTGNKPASDIQAAAREARLGLLRRWCAENSVLHLLLAHHLDDQAETFFLRLARGSGAAGLSGMAAVSYSHEVRLVRPLLSVPRRMTESYLAARRQSWLDDPSNHNAGFARVRARALLPRLEQEGVGASRLADTARRLGRARVALETQTEDFLAKFVAIYPAGYAEIDAGAFGRAPEEIALRALARVVTTCGGRSFGPRAERLERVLERLGEPATLSRCRLLPRGDRVLVTREARGIPSVPVSTGRRLSWDDRFVLRVHSASSTPARVAALGAAGWRSLPESVRAAAALPSEVRVTLPALWANERVLAVPHIGYQCPEEDEGRVDNSGLRGRPWMEAAFIPPQALGFAGFRLAQPRSRIM